MLLARLTESEKDFRFSLTPVCGTRVRGATASVPVLALDFIRPAMAQSAWTATLWGRGRMIAAHRKLREGEEECWVCREDVPASVGLKPCGHKVMAVDRLSAKPEEQSGWRVT